MEKTHHGKTICQLRSEGIFYTEEELKTEIWKPLKGFEEYYEISSLGRFKGKDRVLNKSNGVNEFRKSRILKNNYYSNFYVQLILYVESTRYNFLAHRVVANHFIENPKNLPVINHKNGIRWDNRVVNIEWCTYSENSKHAIDIGLKENRARGERNGHTKLTDKEVTHIKSKYRKGNINDLYNDFKEKISLSAFRQICMGYTWKHLNHYLVFDDNREISSLI